MAKVKDFYGYLNSIAPFETQENWDNSGMLVGDMNAEVKKVAVVLDITHEEIKKAKAIGANLIISHHPVIFNPIKSVTKGSVRMSLLQARSMHSAVTLRLTLQTAERTTALRNCSE